MVLIKLQWCLLSLKRKHPRFYKDLGGKRLLSWSVPKKKIKKKNSQKVSRGSVPSMAFINFIFAVGRQHSVLQCNFPDAAATEVHVISKSMLKLENIIIPDVKL